MSAASESLATKREACPDRWLLEFFRDRSNLSVQSESSALTAWEALELSGVTTDTIVGVVQDISGAKIVDVSALGSERDHYCRQQWPSVTTSCRIHRWRRTKLIGCSVTSSNRGPTRQMLTRQQFRRRPTAVPSRPERPQSQARRMIRSSRHPCDSTAVMPTTLLRLFRVAVRTLGPEC